jgi:Na+/proline symporter
MYALGIFTKRGSKKGIYAGLILGVIFVLWAYVTNPSQMVDIAWLPTFPMHILWIGLLGNLIVFITGYLASMLLSPRYRAKNALTVFKSKKGSD